MDGEVLLVFFLGLYIALVLVLVLVVLGRMSDQAVGDGLADNVEALGGCDSEWKVRGGRPLVGQEVGRGSGDWGS